MRRTLFTIFLGVAMLGCGNETIIRDGNGANGTANGGGNGNGGGGGAIDMAGPQDFAGPHDFASGGGGGGGGGGPVVNLSFSGCTPDFSHDLITVTNSGSMAVTRSDAPLDGQVQLHLVSTGTIQVSTPERVETGDVINLLSNGVTWTNISSAMPDPIKGSLQILDYDEPAGVADLEFTNVVVENVSSHALCTINGTLKSTGKTF